MLNETFHVKLEYHDKLNPTLWHGDVLDEDVRQHLLAIAHEWAKSAGLENGEVRDIIMTGGNVNFNYTPLSDIDVHLLCDFSKFAITDADMRRKFFMAMKDLWAAKHHISVKGYPVELYAQSIDEPTPEGQGVYSIQHNHWIREPQNEKLDFEHEPGLKAAIRDKMLQVRDTIKQNAPLEKAEALKDQLSAGRAEAIAKDGEFAKDNLVFKDLRNRGYLDKLKAYVLAKKDSKLSLS